MALALTWVLCDHTGKPLPGGHRGQARRLIAARDGSMEARITLGLHDQAAASLMSALGNGIPQLRVSLGTTIVFSGHWTPQRFASQIDAPSTLELVFRDAFDRLAHRYTALSVTYTGVDAGLIAKALIDDQNAIGATGILTDVAWVETTMLRDRTYESKNVAEAIVQLTEVINGFDWYPTYFDPRNASGATMGFNVAASQGTDRPTALFEFGAGTLQNCVGYSGTTSLPITRARVIGSTLNTEQIDAAAESIFGVYGQVIAQSDVVELPTLTEKAQDALRPAPVHVTAFTPDPALSPLPWEDFWIGDTVRWNVDDGAMQQQTAPRVQTIEVGVDDSDNVSELVVGIDPAGAGSYMAPANSARRYVQQQQDLRRRLSALERT